MSKNTLDNAHSLSHTKWNYVFAMLNNRIAPLHPRKKNAPHFTLGSIYIKIRVACHVCTQAIIQRLVYFLIIPIVKALAARALRGRWVQMNICLPRFFYTFQVFREQSRTNFEPTPQTI